MKHIKKFNESVNKDSMYAIADWFNIILIIVNLVLIK